MTIDEQLAVLVAGARTFPNNMLAAILIDTLGRAIEINNSGLFRVACILIDKMDRRGTSTKRLREYRALVEEAVEPAEANHG